VITDQILSQNYKGKHTGPGLG